MIRLEEITNRNLWAVCKLRVLPEQEDFVASNSESVAEAFATRNEGNIALPLAAYDGDTPVGFVMIGKGTVGNENESALIRENYCVWRLMVDRAYQGKGYGKAILRAALDLIRTFPYGAAEFVWLSYEPENLRAKELYYKAGFRENGEICDGETVAVLPL